MTEQEQFEIETARKFALARYLEVTGDQGPAESGMEAAMRERDKNHFITTWADGFRHGFREGFANTLPTQQETK